MYQYIDTQIDANLICSVCREPFVDPVEHYPCSNTFCRRCLRLYHNCPKCTKPIQNQTKAKKRKWNEINYLNATLSYVNVYTPSHARNSHHLRWNLSLPALLRSCESHEPQTNQSLVECNTTECN
jgi:hypothetical protein